MDLTYKTCLFLYIPYEIRKRKRHYKEKGEKEYRTFTSLKFVRRFRLCLKKTVLDTIL